MSPRPLSELVSPDWADALQPVAATITAMGAFLRAELAAGRQYLPRRRARAASVQPPAGSGKDLDRGTRSVSHARASRGSVVLSGIPRTAHPTVAAEHLCRAPGGSRHPSAASGDLTPWFQQGVLLLNRVLTVQPGRSGSHRGKGWEQVTQRAIEALVARGGPLVAILWGRDAQSLVPLLDSVPYVASAHPSPLSATAGFFGSRPFSRANDLLVRAGGDPVDWALESTP